MPFHDREIVAIVVGASFAAGLNVYATLLTLGLLAHAHAILLPPSLHLLESWTVMGIAGAMFCLEFIADKVPAFDLIWNALHTFVRVPVAALLAYGATQQLSLGGQIAAAILGGNLRGGRSGPGQTSGGCGVGIAGAGDRSPGAAVHAAVRPL